MMRLLFGGVIDCRDAWQPLRGAAKSAVNRLSEYGWGKMGYGWADWSDMYVLGRLRRHCHRLLPKTYMHMHPAHAP